MSLNPEFRRNLWLELTPQRLILMPIVLGLIFAIGAQFDKHSDAAIALTANLVFGVLVVLWGCRRAAASVAGEVREGTWDWQRMSAITPWTMAWGKLLGSTAFVWYGGIICLAALAYAYAGRAAPSSIAIFVASTAMAGLIGHCVSLSASSCRSRFRCGSTAFCFCGYCSHRAVAARPGDHAVIPQVRRKGASVQDVSGNGACHADGFLNGFVFGDVADNHGTR